MEQGGGGPGLEEENEKVEERSQSDESEEDGDVEVKGDGWEEGNFGSIFAEDLFCQPVERRKQSLADKREERQANGLERAKNQPSRRPQPLAEGCR